MSRLLIAMIADTSTHPGTAQEKIILTTTQITAHRYKYVNMRSNKQQGPKYVIMKDNKRQPFVIPFYLCNVHAPTLSVTRLAEQGFYIQLSDQATITHEYGLDAQLKQKEGLGFMKAEMVHWPRD